MDVGLTPVARTAGGRTTKNTLRPRTQTLLYFGSPMFRIPVNTGWHVAAASVDGVVDRFDPAGAGVKWEVFRVRDDGSCDLRVRRGRTYLIYLTPEEVGAGDLVRKHVAWPARIFTDAHEFPDTVIVFPMPMLHEE